MKTILMKFAAPLQSWGTNSRFETRQTDFYPSKSAVIGMISASLGYKRYETEKIEKLNDLSFGVRIDQQGNLMKDYHTARKYKKPVEKGVERTYITNRYYLEDAIFLVALSGEDMLVEEIETALKSPYFQQFLGRRSCPINYDFILGLENKDLLDILNSTNWLASQWQKKKIKSKEVDLQAYVDSHLLDNKQIKYRQDRVISFSQKDRQFGYRGESFINIKVNNEFFKEKNVQTAHDIFSSLGD
ncbi:MAG: type I-E CRISPR-associated protein Cas5/CasD [Peptostreptococcaceae bacterium]|nr:type I-E CRISPR-associated protein Cas5/CasD [Peptostreptococcaceae bacterium]